MKLLSITVPCYNSQDYMEKCIDSLLVGGADVEIIIVNDGSKDRTAEIADKYAQTFPTIVKVIHQENAGHGGALNTGIKNSTGLYFKVVDSDDWVDTDAYMQILQALRELLAGPDTLDMLISNYVYDKQGAKHKKVMRYKSAFPQGNMFTWDQVRYLHKGQYILMHSVIYRTQLLLESGLELPKHTFYVDNIFVFQPLPYVKTLYYLDINFYRYFIGRDDQSVNETVMITRIDQQLRVTKIMIDILAEARENNIIINKKLRRYMVSYLDINMTIASVMLIRSGTEESLEKKRELWDHLKNRDTWLFRRIRYGILGDAVNLPGRSGRKATIYAYKVARRFFGFN